MELRTPPPRRFNRRKVRGGAARTIKADYWKMGTANFVFHTNDGYAATAVVEYEEV